MSLLVVLPAAATVAIKFAQHRLRITLAGSSGSADPIKCLLEIPLNREPMRKQQAEVLFGGFLVLVRRRLQPDLWPAQSLPGIRSVKIDETKLMLGVRVPGLGSSFVPLSCVRDA